jgi:hypothetical protein
MLKIFKSIAFYFFIVYFFVVSGILFYGEKCITAVTTSQGEFYAVNKLTIANEFSLKRIKECKKLIILNTVTLKELISFTNGDYYFSLEVINAQKQKIANLDYLQTKALLSTYRLYDNIGDILLELKPKKNELG